MDYTVEMSCEMKVDRGCELCRQKVSEVMHCLNGVYSVDFVGKDNLMKLKARVDPNVLLAVIEKYGEHGKIINLRFNGEVMTPRGGCYYGIPSIVVGYPCHYSYPPFPPGNYVYGLPYDESTVAYGGGSTEDESTAAMGGRSTATAKNVT